MRFLRDLAPVLPLLLVLACGGRTSGPGAGPNGQGEGGVDGGGTTGDGGPGGPGAEGGGPQGPLPKSNKVDVLFMIDNSASMGDKQALLAQAVPDIIQGLVSLQVHDMHIGIVTSSLGGRGGDLCPAPRDEPGQPGALDAHNDDHGELVNRGGVAGDPDRRERSRGATRTRANFLSWFPESPPSNAGQPAPLAPAITEASRRSSATSRR